MRIDPHVHCRDGAQNYKETIAHVLRLCDAAGIETVFDMPNTEPPLISAAAVEKRLRLVPRSAANRYRLYLGVTPDEAQIRSAAALAMDRPEVAGLKLYAGESIGSLAIPDAAVQKRIYEILKAAGYRGVLAVHCEKESVFNKCFNPESPATHAEARPPESETASIRDQFDMARAAGYEGHLHICHISLAASVEQVVDARRHLKVTCGVTPHHLLWSTVMLKRPDGLLYKVNPPLRPVADSLALRQALKQGHIDWIETDHAPHPVSEKLHPPYLSGYPSLCLYPKLVGEILPQWGMDETAIDAVTCHNIRKTFGERKCP